MVVWRAFDAFCEWWSGVERVVRQAWRRARLLGLMSLLHLSCFAFLLLHWVLRLSCWRVVVAGRMVVLHLPL